MKLGRTQHGPIRQKFIILAKVWVAALVRSSGGGSGSPVAGKIRRQWFAKMVSAHFTPALGAGLIETAFVPSAPMRAAVASASVTAKTGSISGFVLQVRQGLALFSGSLLAKVFWLFGRWYSFKPMA